MSYERKECGNVFVWLAIGLVVCLFILIEDDLRHREQPLTGWDGGARVNPMSSNEYQTVNPGGDDFKVMANSLNGWVDKGYPTSSIEDARSQARYWRSMGFSQVSINVRPRGRFGVPTDVFTD